MEIVDKTQIVAFELAQSMLQARIGAEPIEMISLTLSPHFRHRSAFWLFAPAVLESSWLVLTIPCSISLGDRIGVQGVVELRFYTTEKSRSNLQGSSEPDTVRAGTL